MKAQSTAEVAERLRRLGFRVSVGSLNQDVLGGLVSPNMPAYETPGRGHPARWSEVAYRRCLYIARLRRIGVEGRLLPLVAFLHDGWGWRHIREQVSGLFSRGVEIDRRDLRRLGKSRSPAQLDLLVDSGNPRGTSGWQEAILPARRFMTGMVLYGEASASATMTPFAFMLLREFGIPVTDAERVQARSLGERIESRRRDLGWSSAQVASWLAGTTDPEAARGRTLALGFVRSIRPHLRRRGLGTSGNVLSWFGTPRSEVRGLLRATTGRPTAPMLLAEFIGQEVFAGHLLNDSTID